MMYNTTKGLSVLFLFLAASTLPITTTNASRMMASQHGPFLNLPPLVRRLVLLAILAFPPPAVLSKELVASETSNPPCNNCLLGASSVLPPHSILDPSSNSSSRTGTDPRRDKTNLLLESFSTSNSTSLLPDFMVRRRTSHLQNSIQWEQVGSNINGMVNVSSTIYIGETVRISGDGKRIVVGFPYNDGNGEYPGHARVYQEVDGTWTQVGQDLVGEAAGDGSGHSVGISDDGKRVVVGAPWNDGNGQCSGHARVYQEVDGTWTQVGQDLDGEAADDFSGRSVGISSDGKRIVVGAPYNDGNDQNSGHARVYQEVDGTWTQVGQDLDGDGINNYFGHRVGISGDGQRVVVAGINTFNFAGKAFARVYQEVDGTWHQVGHSVDGEWPFDYPDERSVSISGDGQRVVMEGIQDDDSRAVGVFAAVPSTPPDFFAFFTKLSALEQIAIMIAVPFVISVLLYCLCCRGTACKQPSIENNDKEKGHQDLAAVLPQEVISNNNGEPQQSALLYDAFLTHNWGRDSQNRDNHNRVVQFKNHLEKMFDMDSLWLDEERMTGDIVQQMCNGIDESTFVIVFVTQKYIDKVAGRGPKGDKDNCLLEFNYAARKKGSSNLIAVVMEDACSDSDKWDGPVGMQLGGHLYFSYKEDSDLQKCAIMVHEEIQRRRRKIEDELECEA